MNQSQSACLTSSMAAFLPSPECWYLLLVEGASSSASDCFTRTWQNFPNFKVLTNSESLVFTSSKS